MSPRPLSSILFPYTTLFRSGAAHRPDQAAVRGEPSREGPLRGVPVDAGGVGTGQSGGGGGESAAGRYGARRRHLFGGLARRQPADAAVRLALSRGARPARVPAPS